ncbi:hypothetical protein UC34_15200 [Pandoraea vervacti]|uniref:Uncharacterized protein n=1 Tax=Pandoraea vervacti TaxID=656178 RepID=A0ABM5SZG2_9BURK|nr:hypothetical protein [Pandoraea vervacti]AJP57954.1 hypothetical protein UC34_15200 [Pandoraea vervacti]
MTHTRFSPATATSHSFAPNRATPHAETPSIRTSAAKALHALAGNHGALGSLTDLAPSPPSVGRFAALLHHLNNFALSASALSVASLSAIKETYDASALSSAHKITLTTATAASLSSLMDLAVAVGKYCNPSSTSSQIQNTAWLASAGKLLGSKHLETYGGRYQSTLLGTSMMLFLNSAGQIAGGHGARHDRPGTADDTATPGTLGLPSASSAPETGTQDLDALESCIGFAALTYRAFGDAATTAVIDWMNAKEARRNMDVVERHLSYEAPYGTEGTFKLRDPELDIEASDDSGVDERSLSSVSSSVPHVMNV